MAEVVVNDSLMPGFDGASDLSAGNWLVLDSNGEVDTGSNTNADEVVGFAMSDVDIDGRPVEQQTTVIPPVKGYVANVIVNKADGSGVSDIAVGDVLYYRDDGTLAKEADGTGGSGRAISSTAAAIALETQDSDDDTLHKVYLLGGD